MNVDTGQFTAISNQIADLGCDLGDVEWDLNETRDYVRRLAEMLTTVLREIAPAVRHTANASHQPRARGRHRADSRHRPLPHCRSVTR